MTLEPTPKLFINPARRRFLLICAFYLVPFALTLAAQDLPDEIRGYKVHNAKISVTNKTDRTTAKDDSEAFARLTEPELVETSLTGLTFAISAEIDPLDYKGKVDFLTFKDFKVNGLSVEIEEYAESFEFKKKEPIRLPKPVRIFLGTGQAIKGAIGEAVNSKEEWTVTGTVFVFGRFKKYGFNVKRVVPVEVNVKIKNPARKANILGIRIPSI
ncbi:MAG: hypothetical protein JSS81_00115 [Acidobacteria bacterium]|nr:hypothetical protein [Acidobacteriota bacterium]